MSDFGIMNATQLLYMHIMNAASDDDRRRLHECEERLVSAGLGNYQDLQELGAVTNNIWRGIKDSDESECRRKIFEIDERLRSAGLDDYNCLNAAKINSVAESLMRNQSRITENNEQGSPEESNITEDLGLLREFPEITSKKPQAAKQHVITSRVGILTAINLLYELEMGIISDYDLRNLGVYEERLKLIGFGTDTSSKVIRTSKKLHETIRVEDLQWPPSTLGTVINNFLTELNENLTNIKDSEAKNLILDFFENQLQCIGLGDHYDAFEIEELAKDVEDLRRIRGKAYGEGPGEDESGMAQDETTEISRETPLEAAAVTSKASNEMTVELSVKAANTLKEEPSTTSVSHRPTMFGPGFVAAVYLLCQLELGELSEDDRRKLGEYEERLKLAGFFSHVQTESAEVPDDCKNISVESVPALGDITNKLVKEYHSKFARTDDLETRNRLSDGFERYLKLAGFHDHFSTAQFDMFWTELAKEVKKRADKDASKEIAKTSRYTEALNELPSVVSVDLPSETLNKLSIRFLRETVSKASIEVPSKCTDENVSVEPAQNSKNEPDEDPRNTQAETLEENSEDMPRTVFATAMYLLFKNKKGQASDDEIKMLSKCEERLKLAGISSDSHAQPNGFEPFPELGKITFNFLLELNLKLNTEPAQDRETRNKILFTYINKLKLAGFDGNYSFGENEKVWNKIEYTLSKIYKGSLPNAGQSRDSRMQVENKISRQMSVQTSNHIPSNQACGESDRVANEEEDRLVVSAQINHRTSTAGQKPLGVVADESPNQVVEQMAGGEKAIELAEDDPSEEVDGHAAKAHAIKNEDAVGVENAVPFVVNEHAAAADPAKEDSNEIADRAWRLVKLDTPTPPVRPCEPRRSEDTIPKDPRVTYVPINIKPERKLVVARRRLQDQAPVDWFSTDPSKPPPGFNSLYADLYSELPLSCRAYAFSARLKEINRQLYNANEPTAYLLRKEYNYVVEAFDRYLSTLQKRVSMDVPTNVRLQRVQPNQEKWRRPIIIALFMSKDDWPGGLSFRPLKFFQPLTARASAVAERLKMVEVKMANANAQQVLLLSKEFSEILASFDKPYHYPIPGEPYIEPTPRPLPADLEQLRIDKNRALKDYSRFPSPQYRQIRNELTSEFRRRIAIWKASEEGQA